MSDIPVRSWVPDDVCSLTAAQMSRRLDEFERLFRTVLRSVRRRTPQRLRLVFEPGAAHEEELQDLTEQEATCCGFFDFTIGASGEELSLDVDVPTDRIEVLTGLEEQATAAMHARARGVG